MSRIGRMPIVIPAGVTVNVAEGNVVTVKGSLGTLTQTFSTRMTITVDGSTVTVTRPTDENEDKSIHGLTRVLINNMVIGVSQGYKKDLEIVGVGYKAAKQGNKLVLNLGHSHQIIVEEKDGITFDVPTQTNITVKGINKELVGEIAAQIRGYRPPEPYHGKGVKYIDEHIRRKAGKTGK